MFFVLTLENKYVKKKKKLEIILVIFFPYFLPTNRKNISSQVKRKKK